MAMSGQALVAVPQTSAPSVITPGNADSQTILIQAMLANMKPEQAASVQAALAQQARLAANRYYMQESMRKLAPAMTNGVATQAYFLNTGMTYNLTTATGGFCEGIMVKYTVNYTLAAGTSAVYGLTPAGSLGLIDNIEVRYNKSQHKIRPQIFKQLGLMGALEDYIFPEAVFGGGQSLAYLQGYLNSGMPTAVGANSVTMEYFFPFNILGYDNPIGLLPIVVGDTGLQVIINTPLAIFGSDPANNCLYAVSGTGHAVSAVSGTMAISAVYRDGETQSQAAPLPFDMQAVQGTFQMQMDTPLNPLIAGSLQRQKLGITGEHAYVIVVLIDGLQSNAYALNTNISYLEAAKDGVGANVFWKYGTQTNLDIRDYWYLRRLDFKQDLDNGVIPFIHGPVTRQGDPHIRTGKGILDNSKPSWPDWRWTATVNAVGSGTLNGLQCTPRAEIYTFYRNPIGLIPV